MLMRMDESVYQWKLMEFIMGSGVFFVMIRRRAPLRMNEEESENVER
jgi:hypothetical protein